MSSDSRELRNTLLGMLIGLARATYGNEHLVTESTTAVILEGLSATRKNANVEPSELTALIARVDGEKRKLVPGCYICACPCGRTNNFDLDALQRVSQDIRSLKMRILSRIQEIAVHAAGLGYQDETVHAYLCKALFAIGMDDWGMEELQPILLEAEKIVCGNG